LYFLIEFSNAVSALVIFVLPLVPVSLQDYQDVLESIPCGFNASASASSFMEVRSLLLSFGNLLIQVLYLVFKL
jgi:hypothetical protein